MFSLGVACGGDDSEDSSAAGEIGEACIGGTFCNNDLECVAGVCMEGAGTSDGDGDGDGDESDGDGDGDESETTGDTGGLHGLYEGPCLTQEDCEPGLWCATANGRYWCTEDCEDDMGCSAHGTASAPAECASVIDQGGLGNQLGCVLVCEEMGECPAGAQCFYSALVDNWCGFLEE